MDDGLSLGHEDHRSRLQGKADWTGVEYGLPWRDQQDCLTARRFLEKLLRGPASTADGHDHFVFDTEQQLDAFYAFRRRLGYGQPIEE